jgi:hypothetical protein
MTSAPEWARTRPRDGEPIELVRLDDARGIGVGALDGFAAGSVIHRFAGVMSDRIDQHSLQVSRGRHIGGTRYIGYLSHGCAPNCRLDMRDFTLRALRDIARGDLLTIDYAETEERLHRQFACLCGADACRGWIVGHGEEPNAEGRTWLADHADR